MKLNPFLNAAIATAYICGVVGLLHYLNTTFGNTPDSFVDPIGAISLLVFSVALMAFLFFYRPITLLLDNKRTEAVSYFTKTLITFGVLTLIVFVAIFLAR